MVKIIALLFTCLALAAVVESKTTSKEEKLPQPCIHCIASETQTRAKRQADIRGILDSIGGLVGNIIHEVGVHRQRQQRPSYGQNTITNIGNGEDNTNNITYNYYYNRYNRPYYK